MLLQDAVELEQLAQHRRGLGELDQENWVTLGPTPPPARAGPAGTPTEGRRFARAPFDLAPLALRGLSWGGLDIDPRAGLEPEEVLLDEIWNAASLPMEPEAVQKWQASSIMNDVRQAGSVSKYMKRMLPWVCVGTAVRVFLCV